MPPEIYHNFRTSYAGHIDGMEVLGHKVLAMTKLTKIDPKPGQVLVHVRNLQKLDANATRNHRVRVSVYGHDDPSTEAIAETLQAAICGTGVVLPPNDLNPDQTFFDHIRSEQAPTENESPGLTSTSYYFDLAAVSRSIA